MSQAVCASPCIDIKGERGYLLFNKCFAEMANDDFFSRLIPPFCENCHTMHEKNHHLPGLLSLVENFFKYPQKFTIKVSLSLFVNKNVRTHSTTVLSSTVSFGWLIVKYREENTSSIALNLARIEIKSSCVWPVRSRISRDQQSFCHRNSCKKSRNTSTRKRGQNKSNCQIKINHCYFR